MKEDKPIGKSYDLVIVGGGVTGAGVFHEAVQQGLSPLLVEANDFAWGTSSRSSKMVHGGLRYLKEGKFLLTRSAVRERQRLLSVYPGLVDPLNFIMPIYDGHGPSMGAMKFGLSLYSLMAGEKQHQIFSRTQTLGRVPKVCQTDLLSGVGFKDAQVDDARLVLRLIFDGCDQGGQALNYTRAQSIERNAKGKVTGVHLKDTETGLRLLVKTPVVINATGAFAETLHPSPVKGFHIRPLRGSHLVFPGKLYPMDRVISFIHPLDKRPVFLFPWEGCLFLGTTDVDHTGDVSKEPCITMDEAKYLMAGLAHILPDLKLSLNDCIASIAGVRPILSKKKVTASKESREHVVWKDRGLVTITGGKLTTFRLLAADALRAAQKYLPRGSKNRTDPARIASGVESGSGSGAKLEVAAKSMDPGTSKLSPKAIQRLLGRYGKRAGDMAAICTGEDFFPIATTRTLWAELCHGARHEQIRHLSDLLLRRVRIGLFLPNGGMDLMDEIQARIQPFLSWDDAKWTREKQAYEKVWQDFYAPPGHKKTK
ncbi:MAG: glycerol-3-phosphate dehydrogenase/oxidase [Desulfobacteraceae bacterium]|nr:glycerol-3-phosphate dehydrogenase/oxidase [Desulfobacteraceae bacterium]